MRRRRIAAPGGWNRVVLRVADLPTQIEAIHQRRAAKAAASKSGLGRDFD